MPDDLTQWTAVRTARALASGEVRPRDVVEASARRIEAVDPALNALPTLCLDRAFAHAEAIEARRRPAGRLGGLPLAIKDLNAVAGVRTTLGSPIYADHVPSRSDAVVDALETDGGIVIGKSNTPEFGAGAQTFNEVFGRTVNPWDTHKTCGGSSGGAAVALASGMVWLAQGSDLGGSLRTPASFCSVVGLRPGLGLVPSVSDTGGFDLLSVNGPMGRTVADTALMLDSMAVADPRDVLSRGGSGYLSAAEAPVTPARIAYSRDLGVTPVDPEVLSVTDDAIRKACGNLGVTAEEGAPDLRDARETFLALRALSFVTGLGSLYESHRDKLKPDVIWNIEAGLALDSADIAKAMRARTALYHRTRKFFDKFDLLVCPTAVVPPFPVEQRYVERVGDQAFDTYIDWIAITFAITLTGCPALSLPAGFTPDGLPVGLQLVGPPQSEARLIAYAAAFEAALGTSGRTPIDPRTPAGDG